MRVRVPIKTHLLRLRFWRAFNVEQIFVLRQRNLRTHTSSQTHVYNIYYIYMDTNIFILRQRNLHKVWGDASTQNVFAESLYV